MNNLKFEKKSGFKDFLMGKGYYVALAICILAVGVAGWTAVRKINSPPVDEEDVSMSAASTEQQAGAAVTNIPNTTTRSTTIATTTSRVSTTEKTSTKPVETTTKKEKTEADKSIIDDVATHTPFESYYMFPLGSGISKDYSNGELIYSKTMTDWRVHNGIDFNGAEGDSIKAINDGIINKVYEDPMWGTVVEINHGGGMTGKYCGLASNPPVKANDEIKMGQVVGMLGEIPIESEDGAHLHLEIYVDEKIADPLAAMSKGEDQN